MGRYWWRAPTLVVTLFRSLFCDDDVATVMIMMILIFTAVWLELEGMIAEPIDMVDDDAVNISVTQASRCATHSRWSKCVCYRVAVAFSLL